MFFVAVLDLAAAPEVEAPALAADLRLTAFEAAQALRGVAPFVLLRTADEARARALQASLQRRGHRTVLGDPAQLPRPAELRDFRLHDDAVVRLAPTGEHDRLPWRDVTALVRATHQAQESTTEVTRERKFNLGRAIATQGLVMTSVEKRETELVGVSRTSVLYVFRRAGAPWLAAETRCRYEGLGPALKPGRAENFATLVRRLRERAPQARFDERLLQTRGLSVEDIDLRAHLLSAG